MPRAYAPAGISAMWAVFGLPRRQFSGFGEKATKERCGVDGGLSILECDDHAVSQSLRIDDAGLRIGFHPGIISHRQTVRLSASKLFPAHSEGLPAYRRDVRACLDSVGGEVPHPGRSGFE